jgi:inosine-uridine nucleoside N-ribohydrolase
MQGQQRQPIAQQAAALPRWPHETHFPENQAVEFLAETIRSYPGEVTLLTIGPLTNIGLLFSKHPDVAPLLRGLVMMGGSFGEEERVEWNIAVDPLAAEIVYRTPVRLHRSLGLNVTRKLVMPAEEARKSFTAPLLKPVLDMSEIWFSGFYPSITFHDPLAAATLFEPGLCSYEQGTVRLDNTDKPGKTIWEPGGADAPHQVAMTVDPDRYFDHFFSILSR